MKTRIASIVIAWGLAYPAAGQHMPVERLSIEILPVTAPSGRVEGPPGRMRITEHSCPAVEADDLRQRIVDIAVQEWGFFGFTIVDQTNIPDTEPPRQRRPRRRTPWLNPEESARVADSIAGYWSITPDGSWILSRQNDVWQGLDGVAARWRDPWSAAFISWVMCESGLGDAARFRRAIAHHSYIDQAISARDKGDSTAAFVAYDIGEQPIEPGDMLCAARRPHYRSIAERREQLGTGIRSHCDIVVKVDEPNARILVIGGNVRGAVSLKLHAAEFQSDAAGRARSVGRGRRTVFAHLRLRAPSSAPEALESSPTIQALLQQRDDSTDSLRRRLQSDASIRIESIAAVASPIEPQDSSL